MKSYVKRPGKGLALLLERGPANQLPACLGTNHSNSFAVTRFVKRLQKSRGLPIKRMCNSWVNAGSHSMRRFKLDRASSRLDHLL